MMHNGFRQFEPSTSVCERHGLPVRKYRQKAPRHLVAEIVRAAAQIHFQVDGTRRLAHAVQISVLRRESRFLILQLRAQLVEMRLPLPAQPAIDPLTAVQIDGAILRRSGG